MRVVLILIVVVAGVIATGWPQRKIVEYVAGEALSAVVTARGMSLLGAARIDEIRVYDSEDSRDQDRPVFVARDVVADYVLFPGVARRYLESVVVSHLEFSLDARDPAKSNYAFLANQSSPDQKPHVGEGKTVDDEPTASDTRFLPRSVDVQYVTGKAAFPDGELTLDGIRGTGTLRTLGEYDVRIRTNAFRSTYWIGEPSDRVEITEGFFRIDVTGSHGGIGCVLTAAIPGFVEAQGSVNVPQDSSQELAVAFPTLRFFGTHLPAVTQSLFPSPVQFDLMEVTGLTAQIRRDDPLSSLPDADTGIAVYGLVVGDPAAPDFNGDVELKGSFRREAKQAELTGTLGPEQILEATFEGDSTDAKVTVSFADWKRDDVTRLVPVDFRTYVESLEYDRLKGSLEITWDDPAYAVTADISSQGGKTESNDAIRLTVDGEGSTDEAPLFDGAVTTKLGDGAVTVTARADTARQAEVTVALKTVELAPWARFFAEDALPEDLRCIVSGDIAIAATEDGDEWSVTPVLRLVPLEYQDFSFENVEVTADLGINRDFNRIRLSQLKAESETTNVVTLSDWVIALDPMKANGKVESALDVMVAAKAFEIPEFYGNLAVTSAVQIDGDIVEAPLTLKSDLLGYGEYALPYGSVLEGGARLAYNLDTSKGTLTDIQFRLGEGTRLSSQRIDLAADPVDVAGAFSLVSDLKAVADMALLETANAPTTIDGEFRLSGETLSTKFAVAISDGGFILPDQMATIAGATIGAIGSYDGALAGDGTVAVEQVTVSGANLTGVRGAAAFVGDDLQIRDASAQVFGGTITATVDLGVLREGLPIRLNASFENIDFTRLTEEVKPPEVVLTGIANGSATVGYSAEGLTEFVLYARSNQEFSINRDMVGKLLQNDQFKNTIGSGKVEKAMEKFLGTAPQRPFDDAELKLRYEDGRIRGTATLTSQKTREYNGLNMTVEIAMDPGALGQALILLEQSSVKSVEF